MWITQRAEKMGKEPTTSLVEAKQNDITKLKVGEAPHDLLGRKS